MFLNLPKDTKMLLYQIVSVINLNNVKLENQSWISKEIIKKVNFHLEKNDQVLFFLNRSFHQMCFVKNVLIVFRVQIVQ